MEHDIENTIREKVDQVERSPVAWEKELVWSTIERGSFSSSRRPIYYAAASVAVVIGFTFLFSELAKRKQLERLNSLELAIEHQEAKPITIENKSSALSKECFEPLVKAPLNKKHLWSSQKIKTNIQITNLSLVPAKEESLITKAVPQTEISAPNEAVIAKNVEPVHAIFGVEEKPVVTSFTKKEKKLRIRLFKAEDEKEPIQISSEPTNLLARINKN